MKKIIILAGFALLLASCAEKPGFQITGTVSDATLNGQYVYLLPAEKDAAPLDSALVSNGTFTLQGVQQTPTLSLLRFSNEVVPVQRVSAGQNSPFAAIFTLENAKLTVALDSVSTVKGTPENDAFAAFQSDARDINNAIKSLFENLDKEDKEALAKTESAYDELSEKLNALTKAYLAENATKLLAGKTFFDFRHNLSEEDKREIVEKADSTFKSAPGVETVLANLEILKKVGVGQKFTDFEMADLNGKTKKLSDFAGNGKYVLVDFWASWCPPCRKEMPNLVALYKQYKNKGFEIVGVSLDNDKAAWEKGIKDLNITWAQLSDLKGWQNAGAALYGVNSIPQLVLIDKEGTIIAKNLHGEKLNKKLEELFN